ncbi:hypothetical protein, partial [Mesorhizobium sp. M7A.F.Ca.AU.002.03.1.1]|uniref:hypothetical protein n=1 Tax=Mesorhizobium sp. M7A.F.Ca.AU.002.03.1.1 TaxID=2496672 RepID=UPI001FE0097C
IPNSIKSSEFKTSSLSRNRNFIATFSILETAARVSLPYKRHIFHWLLPYKLHTNFYQLWLCARHHAPRIAIGTAPHQRQAVPHKGRHPAAQLAAEAEASYAVPTASGKIVALAAGGGRKTQSKGLPPQHHHRFPPGPGTQYNPLGSTFISGLLPTYAHLDGPFGIPSGSGCR